MGASSGFGLNSPDHQSIRRLDLAKINKHDTMYKYDLYKETS